MPTAEKVAMEDDLLLMFAYPRQQDPVQALRCGSTWKLD